MRSRTGISGFLAIVFALYAAYSACAVFFFRSHVEFIACPVTDASTIITHEDESRELIIHRHVEVHCDYRSRGIPQPRKWQLNGYGQDIIYEREGSPRRFDSDATMHSSTVTKGAVFACFAEWKTAFPYAFTFFTAADAEGTRLRDCTIAPPS